MSMIFYHMNLTKLLCGLTVKIHFLLYNYVYYVIKFFSYAFLYISYSCLSCYHTHVYHVIKENLLSERRKDITPDCVLE